MTNREFHHQARGEQQHANLAAALAFEEQPEPGLDAIMQRPETPCAVPVEVVGPIQVQQLPSELGGAFAYTTTPQPQQILGADRFRSKVTIISVDNAFLVSTSRNINGTQTAALWPPNVPLVITHQSAITVAQATTAANLSILTEQWTR